MCVDYSVRNYNIIQLNVRANCRIKKHFVDHHAGDFATSIQMAGGGI